MMSEPNHGFEKRMYEVNVRNITFIVKWKFPGWAITVKDDDSFLLPINKARDVLKKTNLNALVKYVNKRLNPSNEDDEEEEKIVVPPEEVYDAFNEQFVQKVIVRASAATPAGVVPIYMRLPLSYNKDVGIALAFTYSIEYKDGDYVFTPRIVMYRNGELRTYRLDEVLNGVPIEGTNYVVFIDTNTFENVKGLELPEFEKAVSSIMESIASRLKDSIPRYEDVMRWVEVIRNSGVDVMELLRDYVRQKAGLALKCIWQESFSKYAEDTISLLSSVGITAPISDFVFRVVVSSPAAGSGKSVMLGTITSFIGYRLVVDDATPAALSRLMDFADCIVVDDPHINEQLVKILVQSYRKESVRVITDTTTNKVIKLKLGSMAFLADLGDELYKYDTNGALLSRSLRIRMTKDRRIVKLRDLYVHMPDTPISIRLGNAVYNLRIRDLYAIDTAFFLLTASKLYMIYEEFIKENEEKGEEGKLGIDPRTLQALSSLFILARVAGEDYEKSVWEYAREMSEAQRLADTAYDFLFKIAEEIVNAVEATVEKKDSESEDDKFDEKKILISRIKPYAYIFEDPSNPLILVRPRGLIEAAEVVLSIEEKQRKPADFEDERKLAEFIRKDALLGKLFVEARDTKGRGGKYYPHFIITEDTISIIEYAKLGRINEGERVVRQIREFVCKEYADLIRDGKVRMDCGETLSTQQGGGTASKVSEAPSGVESVQSQKPEPEPEKRGEGFTLSQSFELGHEGGSGVGSTEKSIGTVEGSSTQPRPSSPTQPSTKESGEVLREVIPRSRIREVVRELLSGDGHEPTNQ